MSPWPFENPLPLITLAKRLSPWLVAISLYCLVVALVLQWENIQLSEFGTEAGLINSLILGLLLSFRNRAAYERWWEARQLWGQITNDSRNLAGKLAAFVPAEALANAGMANLLSGFAEALKQHLRLPSPRLRDIPGFEHDSADPPHLPVYLLGRMYEAMAGWKRAGLLDGDTLRILDPHLRGLLDACGGCERIRHTPLSPLYKSLLRAGIFLNVLLSPWYTLMDRGLWGLPIILLFCFFLLGVELIDTIVEEPFGTERDDLDLEGYCQTIRAGVMMSLPSGQQ